MTRPSDFILNSDYLTIAQTDKTEQTVTIGGGTVTTQTNITQDFMYKSTPGTVSRFMIRAGTDDFTLGNELVVKPVWDANDKVLGNIRVYRVDDSTCRFSLTYQNMSGNPSSTFPAMTYTIKIVNFKSPNVL